MKSELIAEIQDDKKVVKESAARIIEMG